MTAARVVCLPGDDFHVSVNMRGGPEKWQVTGWLQIIDLQKQHEGDYTCIAQNEHGVDKATARVNVVEPGEGQSHLSLHTIAVDKRVRLVLISCCSKIPRYCALFC